MASGSPNTESIYDLLYVDSRRIASYVAQVDPNGLHTGTKSIASTAASEQRGGKIGAHVVEGTINRGETKTEALERQFDPVWNLPLVLMDRLDELGFIHRDPSKTPLGGLLLIKTGYLRLLDIRMLREMWPTIAKMMEFQEAPIPINRQQRRGKSPQLGQHTTENDKIAEVIGRLPHAIELQVLSVQGTFWSTLNPDHMLASAEDISLKHGSTIAGEWHVLGVLDAHPGETQATHDAWTAMPSSGLSAAMAQLLQNLRSAMGRPTGSFGITPIMLFRTMPRAATYDL